MNTLPSVTKWKYRPVFLKRDPDSHAENFKVDGVGEEEAVPIGIPVAFESDLFEGKLLIRVRDLETSENVNADKEYFHGRKRLNQYVVQGKFKKEIHMRNVLFGGEYKDKLKMAPPAWFERIMLRVFRRINPGLFMKLTGDKPYVLGNILGGAQVVRADAPGKEPDITSPVLEENNEAFQTYLKNGKQKFPTTKEARRKFFGNSKNIEENMVFDTNSVYTFEQYDNLVDFEGNKLLILSHKFDIETIMGKEPFQIMAKDTESGKHLWSFQFWHEKFIGEEDKL